MENDAKKLLVCLLLGSWSADNSRREQQQAKKNSRIDTTPIAHGGLMRFATTNLQSALVLKATNRTELPGNQAHLGTQTISEPGG
eukprot:scaffold6983_cov51-Cylindrotheca_fusiformis.AAC.1